MEYREGSVITYDAFGGLPRVVFVETKEADVKNGRPGFSGTVTEGVEAGSSCWGYDNQITAVNVY